MKVGGMTTTIRGGFFWVQDQPVVTLGDGATLEACVVMARPRWWQISTWWAAARSIYRLPYTRDASGPAVAVSGLSKWTWHGEHIVVAGDLIVTAEELAREPSPDARRQLLKRKAANFEGSMAERLRELGYEVA